VVEFKLIGQPRQCEFRNGDTGVDRNNATPKRQLRPHHPSGALLGLKPSRIIHLNTFIVRHAMLIYSSTPLNAVHTWARCGFAPTLTENN